MSLNWKKTSVKAARQARTYAQQRKDAAAIAFVVLAEGGQIDNVTASEQSLLFSEWEPGISYSEGQLRRYGDTLYRCVQAHTSQADWTPPATPALWAVTSDPADEWPEWSQPLGAHDASRFVFFFRHLYSISLILSCFISCPPSFPYSITSSAIGELNQWLLKA